MNKRTKSIISLLLCLSMLSALVCFSSVSAGALPAEVKGRTFSEVLGMDPEIYLNWLSSHENDNYYLGTPYKSGDHRNPNGDCEGAYGSQDSYGVPSMNCTGFVWHVLTTATRLSGGDSSSLPAMSGWVSFYNNNNISRRYFSTKEDMLNSGYLEKGDIIWMFEGSEYALSNYNHVGIYWGDGTSDLLWHSSNQGYFNGSRLNANIISTVIPAAQNAQLYVVLKMGVPKVKLQLVRTSADTEITDNSKLYSLQGSEYNVYTSQDCSGEPIGTITTDSDGYGFFGEAVSEKNTDMADAGTPAYDKTSGESVTLVPGTTYYCKEAKPSKGFNNDETVYVFKDSGSVTQNDVKIYRAYNIQTNEQPICQPIYYYPVDLKYDFNKDGILSVSDGTVLQKLLVKLISPDDSQYDFSYSDVNGDGSTDIVDVTAIQKMLTNIDLGA